MTTGNKLYIECLLAQYQSAGIDLPSTISLPLTFPVKHHCHNHKYAASYVSNNDLQAPGLCISKHMKLSYMNFDYRCSKG
jgi:hypothetical protein